MIHIITAGSNDEYNVQIVIEGTLPKSGRELWDEFIRELEKPIGVEPILPWRATEEQIAERQRWFQDRQKLVEAMCDKYGVSRDAFCETYCFIEHLKQTYGVKEVPYETTWTEP